MENTITINSLDDVVFTLQDLLQSSDTESSYRISIQNLPDFKLYLKGDKFDNSITPSIMQGIIELQKCIYRAYMLARYGNDSLKPLSNYERNALELKVVVNPGSADVFIKLLETFDKMFGLMDGMESRRKFIIILTVLAVIAGGVGWLYFDSYLGHQAEKINASKEVVLERERTKQILESQQKIIDAVQVSLGSQYNDSSEKDDVPVSTTENEVDGNPKDRKVYFKLLEKPDQELMATIKEAKESDARVGLAVENTENSMRKLMASTANADFVRFNNQFEASGFTISKISSLERLTSEDKVIKDYFRVLTIDSHKSEFMQARLRPIDHSFPDFNAQFSDSSMSQEKLERLKTALTGYHPIFLAITAKERRNHLSDALISQVGGVDLSKDFRSNNDDIEEA